jgi:hypothetical protein
MKSVLWVRIYVVLIRNTAESCTATGTGTNISFRLINTNETSVADPDLFCTDLQKLLTTTLVPVPLRIYSLD